MMGVFAPRRSVLLVGLSYPMLLVGLGLLLLDHLTVGVTLTACGTFLIGVTELCLSLTAGVPRRTN